MSEKKSFSLIITIIVLAIIAIALGLTMLSSQNPLQGVINKYQRNYPNALISIQKISGENAKAAAEQVKQYCPDFSLQEYYIAQINDAAMQKNLVFIINTANGRTECMIDRSTTINTSKALNQNLLATVNNEPIYMADVTAVYNNIPEQQRTNNSLQQALDTALSNKLLLQDAAKKGLTASDEEINNAINTLLTNNGLTAQQLEQNILSTGSTIQNFRRAMENSILLQKEINEIAKNVPEPTEDEMKSYYDANKQLFVSKAKAKTRQILMYANESNANEKLEQIKSIASQLNSTNFCELATKYSEDLISVPRCGLYEFEEGQLLPEYEQVVFSSEPGTAKIVNTRLGYHIVYIESVTLPQQISYEEAKEQIRNNLVLVKKQYALNEYVGQLRSQAQIVSYIDNPAQR